MALFFSGFIVPFTNDYSKFSNFLDLNKSLWHLLAGALAGVAVYPERFSWEKEHEQWYTVRRVVGIMIIVGYTIRNLKHVRNLKSRLIGSSYADKGTFWNSSYIKQEMQLLLGVAIGSIVFMIVANSKNTVVPIASLSAFCVLLAMQNNLNTVINRTDVVNFLKGQIDYVDK